MSNAKIFYSCFLSIIFVPVILLISPSAHGMQSKQHIGFPFCTAFLVPGGQFSLHTDIGTYDLEKNK